MSENVASMPSKENVGGAAWLDVESEPAVFQDILRKLGVRGVKVQELYGLDDDYFCMLTGQVLGLIFLFNYRQVDGEEEEDVYDCPEHVWFANQTANNSCATVAMLNILLNVPGIKLPATGINLLGDLISSTAGLAPAERGQRLSENEQIRQIHNGSAREMDAINASLLVQNEFDAWVKSGRSRKKQASTKRKRTSGGKANKKKQDSDEAFHYIAYVPIGKEVWRLDGLLKQPRNLGQFEGDWTAFARQNILQRIDEEETLDYNLMALCASEEQTLFLECLKNAISIEKVKQNVSSTQELAHYWTSDDSKPMEDRELFDTFGITDHQLSGNDRLTDEVLGHSKGENYAALLKQLIKEQNELKATYLKHMTDNRQDDVDVEDEEEEDFTDATYEILKTLVDAGILPAKGRP